MIYSSFLIGGGKWIFCEGDALYEFESMRRFADLKPFDVTPPDETTILTFRHLLDALALTGKMLHINGELGAGQRFGAYDTGGGCRCQRCLASSGTAHVSADQVSVRLTNIRFWRIKRFTVVLHLVCLIALHASFASFFCGKAAMQRNDG